MPDQLAQADQLVQLEQTDQSDRLGLEGPTDRWARAGQMDLGPEARAGPPAREDRPDLLDRRALVQGQLDPEDLEDQLAREDPEVPLDRQDQQDQLVR